MHEHWKAIVNNLPPLMRAGGADPRRAAALSVAAVALTELLDHWDEIEGMGDEQVGIV